MIHFIGNGPELPYQLALLRREFQIARLRAPQRHRAQAKAKPFDAKVQDILRKVEQRRGMPVPARARAGLLANAILKTDGGNPDSIRRRVRESLRRQRLR